jgi:hypothetical protein
LSNLGFKVKEKGESIFIDAEDRGFREIYKLKEKLKNTVISGFKGIKQVLVVKRGNDYVVVTLEQSKR